VRCAERRCDAINNPKKDNKHDGTMNSRRNIANFDSAITARKSIEKRGAAMSNLRKDRRHGAVGVKSESSNHPAINKCVRSRVGGDSSFADLPLSSYTWISFCSANLLSTQK
jgi:hypothetical protein